MILSQAKDTRGPLNLFIFVLFILIRKCLTVSTIDEPHSRQKRWFIEPGNCAGVSDGSLFKDVVYWHECPIEGEASCAKRPHFDNAIET